MTKWVSDILLNNIANFTQFGELLGWTRGGAVQWVKVLWKNWLPPQPGGHESSPFFPIPWPVHCLHLAAFAFRCLSFLACPLPSSLALKTVRFWSASALGTKPRVLLTWPFFFSVFFVTSPNLQKDQICLFLLWLTARWRHFIGPGLEQSFCCLGTWGSGMLACEGILVFSPGSPNKLDLNPLFSCIF